ncbi:MAG: acyl-CoA dehydrogenase family protein, partial [Thermocrispum sp.]
VLDVRGVLHALAGRAGPESSVRKLIGVRHRQEVAEVAMQALGPAAAADDDSTHDVLHEFLLSRCLSIAGGTTQVLLNVAAERLLGLPR